MSRKADDAGADVASHHRRKTQMVDNPEVWRTLLCKDRFPDKMMPDAPRPLPIAVSRGFLSI